MSARSLLGISTLTLTPEDKVPKWQFSCALLPHQPPHWTWCAYSDDGVAMKECKDGFPTLQEAVEDARKNGYYGDGPADPSGS